MDFESKARDFESEASELAWENFKATGDVGMYMLFHGIETAENTYEEDEELAK